VRTAQLNKACIAVVSILLSIAPSQIFSQDASSCGYSDWFAAQAAEIQGKELTALCQGELDAGEDHRSLAESELNAVIKTNPRSPDAYEAHSALAHFYLRIGRFHDAELQIQEMSSAKPTAPDLVNVRSLFALLGTHSDMTVSVGHSTTVRTHTIDGNVFSPVTVNGSVRSYMLDTGLDLSLMSEAEAAHLGLKPESSTTKMSDISGMAGAELRLVVVDDLLVGATHIRHVPFMVVADTNGAFVGIPPDQHGILGIQPLVALEKLSFQADGMLTISGNTNPIVATLPLMFAGTSPLTQIKYYGQTLPVTFDTGATQTTFNPPFAKLFPELVESGKKQNHDLNGLSGKTVQPSVSVPQLSVWFGRDVEIAHATILLDKTTGSSAWAAANLGYDLMQQARPFTVDFQAMKVEFTARH
jgi:hypothetical protein